jgi:(4S)-4-hydroxy-5-phosphonooxypentane-2,3-dione isomerase
MSMLVVCVHVHVKPEYSAAFAEASRENARSTIEEPGNLRFDVLQQADDPNQFILYEVYRDEAAMKAHKETQHYARWAEAVAPWMAEPRKGVKYASLFPENPKQWSARPDGP